MLGERGGNDGSVVSARNFRRFDGCLAPWTPCVCVCLVDYDSARLEAL